MITVVRPGPLTTVQDLGRPGWAHLGVPRSGALDAAALRLANRLVGNPEGFAGLETTLLGCAVRFDEPAVVAVTGAPAAVLIDGAPGAFSVALTVPAGATVDVARATAGVRTYLAVAGGIDVPPVLGSRSTDTLAQLGPPALARGAELPIGPRPPAAEATPSIAAQDHRAPVNPGFGDTSGFGAGVVLRLLFGPREDWFTAAARRALVQDAYAVSPVSNRVGVRLVGPSLQRTRSGELPSEGVVLGAVQVPADGQPLIFLADHPTTGGYPVIGVVHDVGALAQARPGTTVYFRDTD